MRASFVFCGDREYPLFSADATEAKAVASFNPPGQARKLSRAGCRICGSKIIFPARGRKKIDVFFSALPGNLSGFFKNNEFLIGIQILKEEEEGEEAKPKTEEIPKIEVIVKDKEKPEEEIPSETESLEEEPEEEVEEVGWGSGESSIVGKKAPEEEEEKEG